MRDTGCCPESGSHPGFNYSRRRLTGLPKAEKLEVISGPEELAEPAKGAVEQWRWRPYLLNGVPFEVDTKIQINFDLR